MALLTQVKFLLVLDYGESDRSAWLVCWEGYAVGFEYLMKLLKGNQNLSTFLADQYWFDKLSHHYQ
ncbi:hypothetical protein H6G54_02860 [Anabaena cylindrica FACHB-243]|uniref:hypothetical protein n=1 Tax=Anabaena TaxID=1163 RepID=UPI0005A692FA|nr:MULTISPECIES: hypothetical protein [Anabaena]MBD2416667.1 hypothetical protein [Anabaena cylindrica FACHB-243]MBY5285662.1 hypothetical protein [Anabaena sp. CCAP 1446/1C]MBY5311684.1 hypothetical protein [Anabaena sp. CCAP 1446/1C]MCM2409034.1 hypothetical protein [Anabaena sp. CCAP 1446/1C]BAY06190.1 hypothetical protein NIES19_54730 [Anabaena cylindrica PCC 7122]